MCPCVRGFLRDISGSWEVHQSRSGLWEAYEAHGRSLSGTSEVLGSLSSFWEVCQFFGLSGSPALRESIELSGGLSISWEVSQALIQSQDSLVGPVLFAHSVSMPSFLIQKPALGTPIQIIDAHVLHYHDVKELLDTTIVNPRQIL